MYNREYTSERIIRLEPNEIFVFGSNLAGAHGGGAARIALDCFGAVWGQGVGLQGQSYAIPTMQGGVETIKPYVDEFIGFARQHPELKFLVTRIGCGIAGFRDEEIAPLFTDAIEVENVILPIEFVEAVKNAVGESSLSAMNERYDNGERSSEFMSKYLTVLSAAYESDKAKVVAEEMLEGKGQELLDNPALFKVFIQYCSDPLSAPFQYVLDHKDEFVAKYSDAKLDRTLASKWMAYPHTLIKRNSDGTTTFDEVAMKAFVEEMKNRKVEDREEIVLLSNINVAEATNDWSNYAKYCTKYIKRYGENDMNIYNWSLRIQQKCKNSKVRKTAISWMQKRIDNLKKEEAKRPPLKEGEIMAIPMNNFAESYKKLIEQLKQ